MLYGVYVFRDRLNKSVIPISIQKLRHDVKDYAMMSGFKIKNTPGRKKHVMTPKTRHDAKQFVMTSKLVITSKSVSWRQKYVMTSKSL